MSVILASSSLLVAASPSSEVHRDFNISSAYIETRNSFSNDDLCSENSLFLGHGGSRLIAFYRSRGRLVDVQIVSHDGGRLSYFPDMRSATLRGRTFVSINSLLPVAITRDGFVSRSASSRFLAFRESGSEMGADSVKITDLPRMQFLHVAGADTDQSSLVYARHLVRNILRNYRTSDLRTDASAGLVSNIGASFRWYKYPSLDAPANATGSFFRDYKFLFRQIYDPKVVVRNGHDSLIGLGEIDGGDNHAAFEIPGSSAIIDPRTGTLAGSFNEKMMRVRVGGKYTTFSAPKLGRILDAAVSGQSVAWLYQEADHRVLKWRNGAKEVQIRTRCPIEPREDKGDLDFWTGQQATAWIPPIVRDYALLDLGQKTRVLPAQFYQNSDRSIIIRCV